MVSGHKKGVPYIAKVADKRVGSKISSCTGVPLVCVAFSLNFLYLTTPPVQDYLASISGRKAASHSSVPGPY